MPERVVNLSLRSAGIADLVLLSDIFGARWFEAAIGLRQNRPGPGRYSLLALRNDVMAKNRNNRATATAMPMSQRATSRVQARRAALSQPSARTAKTAPMAS